MKKQSFISRKTEYEKSRRRGFTVVETVVSMALVGILSVAALATVQTSLRTLQKSDVQRDVLRESENVITCYQSADFSSALSLLYGVGIENTSGFTLYFTSERVASTKSEGALWRMVVTVSENESEHCEKLSLAAEYIRSGDTIYSTSYTHYHTA